MKPASASFDCETIQGPLDEGRRRDDALPEARLTNLISDLVVPRLVRELEVLPWDRTHVRPGRLRDSLAGLNPVRPGRGLTEACRRPTRSELGEFSGQDRAVRRSLEDGGAVGSRTADDCAWDRAWEGGLE